MLKVPLNSNGFFLEAHMKLRPVDFATDGFSWQDWRIIRRASANALPRRMRRVARATAAIAKGYVTVLRPFRKSTRNVALDAAL